MLVNSEKTKIGNFLLSARLVYRLTGIKIFLIKVKKMLLPILSLKNKFFSFRVY